MNKEKDNFTDTKFLLRYLFKTLCKPQQLSMNSVLISSYTSLDKKNFHLKPGNLALAMKILLKNLKCISSLLECHIEHSAQVLVAEDDTEMIFWKNAMQRKSLLKS